MGNVNTSWATRAEVILRAREACEQARRMRSDAVEMRLRAEEMCERLAEARLAAGEACQGEG